MNAAVGLMDGLGLDGDRCIRVIPRHSLRVGNTNTKNLTQILIIFRKEVLINEDLYDF